MLIRNLPFFRITLTFCEFQVYGLKIYGAPWQTLWGWAFYRKRGQEIAKEWEKIPTATKSADGKEWLPGVDVLVTHGPPLGCKDLDVRDRKTRFGDLEVIVFPYR